MENTAFKNIPNCLRKCRKVKGFSQNEVALILGLKSTSMISRWEKGVCLPELINALKLASLYGTWVDVMFIDLKDSLKTNLMKREAKILGITQKPK